MPVRFPREGNPHYPLPPDYPELSAEGQRLARVNAVRLRETPEDFVWAWSFFRKYYLAWEDAGFYLDRSESGWMHYEWAYAWGAYRRNIIVAPRGFAKSVVIGTEFPLMNFLSGPAYPTLLVLPTIKLLERRFTTLQRQLEWNQRIRDDFGDYRPGKGAAGIWNKGCLSALSGEELIGTTIGSMSRGIRAHTMVLDDVETDPTGEESADRLKAQMEDKFMNVFQPMFRSINSRFFMVGTSHRRDLFINHAVRTRDDPAFVGPDWNRCVYKALNAQDESTWPEGVPTAFLHQQREILQERFDAEYQGEPRSGEDCILKITEDCEYRWKSQRDPVRADYNPFVDDSIVVWKENRREKGGVVSTTPVERPFNGLVKDLTRVITVDPAWKTRASSDFSAVCVGGLDRLNQLWVLDLMLKKVPLTVLTDLIWREAIRWRVRLVGIEAVALQEVFAAQVADRAGEILAQHGWCPQVVAIKHQAGLSKEDRISALSWRTARGLIKLPGSRRREKDIAELYHQFDYFTPDGGTLDHDDAIDAVAMLQSLMRGARPRITQEETLPTAFERLRRGELVDQYGVPLTNYIDPQRLPAGWSLADFQPPKDSSLNVEWFGGAL